MKLQLYKYLKKGIVLTTVTSLTAGSCLSLAGCKEETRGSDDTAAQKSAEENGDGKETAMGRYLEVELNLPKECKRPESMEFLEDGTLRFSFRNAQEELMYADSQNYGETWEEPVFIRKLLNLDPDLCRISMTKLAKDGGIFVIYTEYKDADSGDYTTNYMYFDKDGNTRELSPDLEKDAYVMGSEFTDQGTVLLHISLKGIAEINLEDGRIVRWYEEGEHVEYFGIAGKHLIVNSGGSIRYYDLETGKPEENQEILSKQITSNKENLIREVTSSWTILFLKGDEDDSLFYVDSTGMYRFAYGGSVVEQIIDGSLNSIGTPNPGFVDYVEDSQGRFYLAVQSGENAKLLRYEYSKDVETVPDTELTVYSLRENSFMRQAAVIFQKKYPDVYLNLETGMTGENAITVTDALKTLNTEIMAGKGPDILVMDGVPADTYIEKGMLEDLSGILQKVDEADGILENIYNPYQNEDGSVYTMPLKFVIPMIAGHQEDVEKIHDLETLADTFEENKERYHMNALPAYYCVIPELLIQGMANVSAGAWIKEDGTLKEEAISDYLYQVYRMYQPAREIAEELMGDMQEEMIAQWMEENRTMSLTSSLLLDGTYQLGLGGIASSTDISDLYSTECEDNTITDRIWNGQEENCFIPVHSVGISSKAAEKDAAKKFVEFLFSQEGQRVGSDGLPVNKAVYEDMDYWKKAETDEGLWSSAYTDAAGEMTFYDVRQAPDEVIMRILESGKTLDKPSAVNEFILAAVTDSGKRYLKDEISLDEAVQAIMQEVNLYLSE